MDTRMQVGINGAQITDWATEMPFINIFSTARPWITQTNKVWDTKESEYLDLDANGYIKSLKAKKAGQVFDSVSTLMRTDRESYPAGKYAVLYEGRGTILYSRDATKIENESKEGREIIEVKPSRGIGLKIIDIDSTDHLRNIRVVPLGQVETFERQFFSPTFLGRVNKDFATYRFMEWQRTNNSGQVKWSDRPRSTDYTYDTNKGMPVEIMVRLANRLNIDPWFSMPHQADDKYVVRFAEYAHKWLKPGLKVYIENSNEAWNSSFEQYSYFMGKGQQTFPSINPKIAGWDYFGQRSSRIAKLWKRTFGDQKDRVIGVLGAQASNPYQGNRLLEYAWAKEPYTSRQAGVDSIAIAPYFGQHIGLPENEEYVFSWTNQSDGGLNTLFDELLHGGNLPNSPTGGPLAEAYKFVRDYKALADKHDVDLVAYEGGQHLVGVGKVVANDAITHLFISANRDPRMKQIYKAYLNELDSIGVSVFNQFNSIYPSNQWGSWGMLENELQATSPKLEAINEFIAGG